MMKDDSAVVFGEDVAFGGVFRCTMVNMLSTFLLEASHKHLYGVIGTCGGIWTGAGFQYATYRAGYRRIWYWSCVDGAHGNSGNSIFGLHLSSI